MQTRVVVSQVTPVGTGNSPPAMNVADSPEIAVRFGSASVRTTPALSIARSVAVTDGIEPNDPVKAVAGTSGGRLR
jgi:thioredoxin-like negative regulator of GroEL